MKKENLTLMTVILLSATVKAQDIYPEGSKLRTVGTSTIEVVYDVVWSHDEERPEVKTNDKMHVLTGKAQAVCWVEREQKDDLRLMENWEKQGRRQSNIMHGMRATFGHIFTGYPKGALTVVKNLDATGVYLYEESVPKLRWTLTADTITVLGYCCQRATCTFRGREYTAWWSEQIPVPYGPWKLQGLPGLILKADTEGFCFTATSMEAKEQDIVFWEREYKTRKRTAVQKQEAMMLKNPAEYLKDYGVNYSVVSFSGTAPKMGYTNFIEKE